MLSEIGSDFWQFDVKDGENTFWWETEGYFYEFFKSGRNAIKALCQILNMTNKTVLLPIYTCESVICPFVEEGWKFCFYNVTKELQIDVDSLERAFNAVHPDVIFFHGYFGFDTTRSAVDALKSCQNKGCILVEDITSNFLSDNRTDFADYYISSLRKLFAIPDGGILVGKTELPSLKIADASKLMVEKAVLAYDAKSSYFIAPSKEKKLQFKNLYTEFHNEIEINDKLYCMSLKSKEIIKRIDIEKIREKRQNNYKQLYDVLWDIKSIVPVLGICTDNITPLFLPIYYDGNRAELQSFLADNDIYCPVIWPEPSQIVIRDDITRKIYENMLCIPIDQRYGVDEMNWIIHILNLFQQCE